jgi:hypothetical protein
MVVVVFPFGHPIVTALVKGAANSISEITAFQPVSLQWTLYQESQDFS